MFWLNFNTHTTTVIKQKLDNVFEYYQPIERHDLAIVSNDAIGGGVLSCQMRKES